MKAKASHTASGRTLLTRWILRGRMTQAEAAKYIGLSRVQLNQYLNTDKKPGLEMAVRIEDATGIGVRSWLVEESAAAEVVVEAVHGTDISKYSM